MLLIIINQLFQQNNRISEDISVFLAICRENKLFKCLVDDLKIALEWKITSGASFFGNPQPNLPFSIQFNCNFDGKRLVITK